jgi:hypothetical protein
MTYEIFANYPKKAAHFVLDLTIPRTPTIALISGGLGYIAWCYYETHGRSRLASIEAEAVSQLILEIKIIPKFFCDKIGEFASILTVPQASPYIASQVALGVSLSSIVILNIFSSVIHGIKAKKAMINKKAVSHENEDSFNETFDSDFIKDCLIEMQEEEDLKALALSKPETRRGSNSISKAIKPLTIEQPTQEMVQKPVLNLEQKQENEKPLHQIAEELFSQQYHKRRFCGCNRLWA